MLRHPVRSALVELLGRRATVTATEAAGLLGGSSGLYSFHLRQLARYGLVEEVVGEHGRARPWRLAGAPGGDQGAGAAVPELAALVRGLEDESYRRWLAGRADAPQRWRRDEAFSQVLYLTPGELTELGAAVRELIQRYRPRERYPARRPPGAGPVAVVARLFPLLGPDAAGPAPGPDRADPTP